MKNRWIILIAGTVIQTILGGIYAWSIFVPHLENQGLTKAQSGSVYGICIAVFTVAMIFGGRLLSRKGPRLTALIGGILFALGYLVAAASNGNYPLLFLGISVLSGAGIGFGYVCPLTVGIQWFPKNKGLITGISVAGFGGGAVVLSTAGKYFLGGGMSVTRFFMWIGIVAGGILIIAALLLASPPSEGKSKIISRPVTSDLFSLPFFICLFGIFVGTFAGLLVNGHLAPIIAEAGVAKGALAVSIFAVGNTAGRILWGFFFDRIKYLAIPASLACLAVVLFILSITSIPWLIMACVALIGFGFGGNFVIYASALSSHFDVASFPKLYPICFLGYGLAGIIGPGIGGYIADQTGSYESALYTCIGMLAVATLLTAAGLKVFNPEEIQDEEPLMEPAE